MSDWIDVASADKVKEGEALGVKAGGRQIALFRLEGEILAMDDVCSHEYALLSEGGFVEGGTVECPLHQACFEIRTGKCVSGPTETPLQVFPVEIKDGRVRVKLD
jgi:nitrite reductase/ring-hydroxylating ferredoxin subunit